jgi:hypothetical protein
LRAPVNEWVLPAGQFLGSVVHPHFQNSAKAPAVVVWLRGDNERRLASLRGCPQWARRANSEPSLWYHNGSVLYLVAQGTLRGISLQRTASRNIRGRRYVRVRFCFGVNNNSGSLAMLAAMRRWHRLIREGHSSRSRDGNGRAREALHGQAPALPAFKRAKTYRRSLASHHQIRGRRAAVEEALGRNDQHRRELKQRKNSAATMASATAASTPAAAVTPITARPLGGLYAQSVTAGRFR